MKTLGEYRELSVILFGEESEATAFLDEQIREHGGNKDEKVIQDEGQVLFLLTNLHIKGKGE